MAYRLQWSHLLTFWAHPFYPHCHCMLEHSTTLECTSVDLLQIRKTPLLGRAFSASSVWGAGQPSGQIPEVWPLLLARGWRKSSDHQKCCPRALMKVKSGLHHRFQRNISDIIGNQIKVIQSQINRRNLVNWCLFLPIKHGVIIRWKAVKDNSAATWNNI